MRYFIYDPRCGLFLTYDCMRSADKENIWFFNTRRDAESYMFSHEAVGREDELDEIADALSAIRAMNKRDVD